MVYIVKSGEFEVTRTRKKTVAKNNGDQDKNRNYIGPRQSQKEIAQPNNKFQINSKVGKAKGQSQTIRLAQICSG